jgi:hypothetical protein
MKHCKPTSRTDDIDERELNELKNLSAHQDLAVVAALHYCVEHGICTPPWANEALLRLVTDLLKREKAQKRGRAAGRVSRLQQDQWDLERWDAVLAAQRIRRRIRRELALHKELGLVPPESLKKAEAWLGHETFACASMLLTGRNARAGVEAMKASYRKVRRSFEDPSAATSYHAFDGAFLKKLGLEDLHDRKPGTKLLPFYNLTP